MPSGVATEGVAAGVERAWIQRDGPGDLGPAIAGQAQAENPLIEDLQRGEERRGVDVAQDVAGHIALPARDHLVQGAGTSVSRPRTDVEGMDVVNDRTIVGRVQLPVDRAPEATDPEDPLLGDADEMVGRAVRVVALGQPGGEPAFSSSVRGERPRSCSRRYSASSSAPARSFSFQRPSSSRATSRFSGSHRSYWRKARSAS